MCVPDNRRQSKRNNRNYVLLRRKSRRYTECIRKKKRNENIFRENGKFYLLQLRTFDDVMYFNGIKTPV